MEEAIFLNFIIIKKHYMETQVVHYVIAPYNIAVRLWCIKT